MESFKAPTALTDTACYYEAACILDEMSRVLGEPNPYPTYKEAIREALLKHFVDAPLSVAGDCQTSDACVVWNQLLPPQEQAALAQQLEQRIVQNGYHLDFGVLGQRYVMETLGNYGYTRTLYEMLRQDTYPSYLYLAKNGCTTLTECWNLGGSHNHVMFSHVSAILYRYIAGLAYASSSSSQPHFTVSPSLLTRTMHCWHETPWGILSIQWCIEDSCANLVIEVPFGCTAALSLPAFANTEAQTLLSGTHHLQVSLSPNAPQFS
jgi:alpha-L-rhamnosidase